MAESILLDLELFRENLRRVQEEVADLRNTSGIARRYPGEEFRTRIVAVTKYLSDADCARLAAARLAPLAENRAQALAERGAVCGDCEWHFIGHLQSNKIGGVVRHARLFHALDSARLARALDAWLLREGMESYPCLVQVNVSGESSKGGISPAMAEESIVAWSREFPRLRLRGLMTMAPLAEPENSRPLFRALRELRERVRQRLAGEAAEEFRDLSMGMSNDYRIAVEEGATLLRIGTLLYHR